MQARGEFFFALKIPTRQEFSVKISLIPVNLQKALYGLRNSDRFRRMSELEYLVTKLLTCWSHAHMLMITQRLFFIVSLMFSRGSFSGTLCVSVILISPSRWAPHFHLFQKGAFCAPALHFFVIYVQQRGVYALATSSPSPANKL